MRPFRRDFFQLVCLGLVLVFGYCGSDWRPQPTLVKWAERLPEGGTRDAMVWLAETLRIFPNAGEGLVRQVKHNVHGHGTYLLGATDSRSIWYYFPVALTIKLSITVLALPLLLLLVRPRALCNWAFLAALALLLFSLSCRVQIGIRLVLPLVVLALVGLAAAAARACQDISPRWGRRLLAGTVAGGVVWTAAAALWVWPNGLCFTNALWGGTKEGYLHLSDSNYDWGQGLRELARWQRRHQVAQLDVWYFGTDPALKKLPMRPLPLHQLPVHEPGDVLNRVQGPYLAVSTTMVYGNVNQNPWHRRATAYLLSRRPVDRTTTFLIYDFNKKE
jgi:hypothetical protein